MHQWGVGLVANEVQVGQKALVFLVIRVQVAERVEKRVGVGSQCLQTERNATQEHGRVDEKTVGKSSEANTTARITTSMI